MDDGLQGLVRQMVGGSMTLQEIQALADRDPEAADRLMDLLGFTGAPQPNAERPGLYWDARHPSQGGTQRVGPSVGAPSADHYRLVDSMEEAHDVLGRGEKPLLLGNLGNIDPDQIDPAVLRQLQEDQWAAPGGTPLFGGTGDDRGLQGLMRR